MSPFLFLDAIARGKPVSIFGEGVRREFTYVGDICAGLLGIMDRGIFGGPQPRIYNLAGGMVLSVETLLHLIHSKYSTISGSAPKLNILRKPPVLGDVPFTGASIERARTEFGYNPDVPIEDGLMAMIRWYMELVRDEPTC